jgi:DNA repair exonuclease SbcCD ATPase subunit
MANQNPKDNFDISKALEAGTKKMTLDELQQKGHQKVKVLDEKALTDLVSRAVNRVVTTQTGEERARILAESRKELDRLMREQKAVRSRAELLEADRTELVAQVEALQRELELQSELEEENLHKKYQEGTASMQSQVEEIRRQLKDARDEAETLRQRAAGEEARVRAAEQARQDLVQQVLRLQSDLEPAKSELRIAKADLIRQRSELEEARAKGGEGVEAERKRREAAEQEAFMLRGRLGDLERAVENSRGENKSAREEARKAAADLEKAREEGTKIRRRTHDLDGELAKLRADADRSAREILELRGALAEARADVERLAPLAGQLAELRESGGRERAELERLSGLLAEEQVKAEAARQVEMSLKSDLAVAEEERERARKALEESRGELGRLVQKTDGFEVELAALREETSRSRPELEQLRRAFGEEHGKVEAAKAAASALRSELQVAINERARSAEELDDARKELAVLRERLEREEREAQERRDHSIVVASQLDEIEQTRRNEEHELERLRVESASLRASETRLAAELDQARADIRSLYDLLAREQALAKTAQDESVLLHGKSIEILGRSGDLERYVGELRQARGRAEEALETARRQLAQKPPPPPKVDLPREVRDRLLKIQAAAEKAQAASESARAAGEKARAAGDRAAGTSVEVGKSTQAIGRLVQQQVKAAQAAKSAVKRAAGPGTPREGVALDGRSLLGEYLRRIRLKELFQKHVPVRDRQARRHPSDMLVELVEASAAGDPKAAPSPKGARIEVVGPKGGSTLDELRAFQGRLSPVAVRSLERVHDGLRNQIVPAPSKSDRLVLDVDLPELEVGKRGRLGKHRPLVAFDGDRGEFWKARLRPAKGEASEGALPFLKDVLRKAPKAVPRERLLLRVDGRLFSEPVIRFLDSSKAGYVIPATDSKELRAAVKKLTLRDVSEGAQVGEFRMRLHPIRKTEGRFVVVRRRTSKRNPPPSKPTFVDGAFDYHVFATDAKTGPWRAWTEASQRPAALASERALLAGFETSPLAGKGRRAAASSFRTYLLTSDLMQWFKRAALPPAEQERTQENLRRELLMLTPPGEKRRETTVLVLPKKDKRRKVYADVSKRLERLRPGAPFKLGR